MPYADPEKRKEYQREYQRAWARRNRDKRLSYERAWNEANPEKRAEINRDARYRYPEKYRAQNTLRRAIYAGKIERGSCEACGSSDDVQAHHDDYSRPLDVRWLCRSHHMVVHRTR